MLSDTLDQEDLAAAPNLIELGITQEKGQLFRCGQDTQQCLEIPGESMQTHSRKGHCTASTTFGTLSTGSVTRIRRNMSNNSAGVMDDCLVMSILLHSTL